MAKFYIYIDFIVNIIEKKKSYILEKETWGIYKEIRIIVFKKKRGSIYI